VEAAKKTKRPAPLAAGRRAHELLATVAHAMKDDWVPQRTAELADQIAEAEREVAREAAKMQIVALVEQALDGQPRVEQALDGQPRVEQALDEPTQDGQARDAGAALAARDAAYEQIDQLLRRHRDLENDKHVQAALARRYDGEARQVRFVHLAEETGAAPPLVASGDDQTAYVVWDESTPARSTGRVRLALARGVLYAFDEEGHHRWSRRLGVDSTCLPLALPPTNNLEAAFLAISSLDNSLVALAQDTGRVLWRYSPADQTLAAPLTISRWRSAPNRPEQVRGLLPTANGEIHVLELARGKPIGKFITGAPLLTGGTFDPATQLAFFPADARRVFAIDPAVIEDDKASRQPARSVLLSGHASGSLRCPPIVVGRYLVLIESADLDHTAVRVFDIKPPVGFPAADARPLNDTPPLRGWTWFAPPAAPDRITIVTDAGEYRIFGFNLDNVEEALYPMIVDKSAGPLSISGDAFRALAIQSEEHLLWAMAGGALHHLSLDLLHQRWRTLWPGKGQTPEITGIPLHEADLDHAAERIYLATRALDRDEVHYSAVNAETGQKIWSRQLGISPLCDTLLVEDRAVLIDRAGRRLTLGISSDGQSLLTSGESSPPRSVAEGTMHWLPPSSNDPGATPCGTLIARSKHDATRIAVRRLVDGADSSAAWQEIALPGVRLQGRPAIVGDTLLAPCSDGRLHRLSISAGGAASVNEQPFVWTDASAAEAGETATITPLADHLALLVNGRQARWLESVTADSITRWRQRGPTFLAPGKLSGEALVTEDFVFLRDKAKTVYRASREQPEIDLPQWSLAEKITSGPFRIPSQTDLVFVATERRLACWRADAGPGEPPLWQAPLQSRLCGQPVALGKYLLVTEQGGRLVGLRLADGQPAGVVSLAPDQFPAGAAVPFGVGRAVVPLVDGTILWQSLRPAPRKPAPPEQAIQEHALKEQAPQEQAPQHPMPEKTL
jgi:outer membrane protein assembly factor BamB